MSVATAKSSDSRTASPSHCSCSERTPVASHGLSCTDDSTARVFLRYAISDDLLSKRYDMMRGRWPATAPPPLHQHGLDDISHVDAVRV